MWVFLKEFVILIWTSWTCDPLPHIWNDKVPVCVWSWCPMRSELQWKASKKERVSILFREKYKASPCTKPCVSPAPNYSHLGMTNIHASALASAANNQDASHGRRGECNNFSCYFPLRGSRAILRSLGCRRDHPADHCLCSLVTKSWLMPQLQPAIFHFTNKSNLVTYTVEFPLKKTKQKIHCLFLSFMRRFTKWLFRLKKIPITILSLANKL